MTAYEQEDKDVLSMPYKNHGPGGELPTFRMENGSFVPVTPALGTEKKGKPEASRPMNSGRDRNSVKAGAVKTVPYALASCIVFYWQQSGQLAETTGFWALIVLALLVGVNFGRIFCK